MRNRSRYLLLFSVLVSTAALADIIIHKDGTIECTSDCHGTLDPKTGSGTVCSGDVCVSVGGGGVIPVGKVHK